MTKIVVSVQPAGGLSVDLQLDLNRAVGGPLNYYRLSRIDAPASEAGGIAADEAARKAEIAQVVNRILQAVDLRADGVPIPLQLESVVLPDLPEEDFVNPLSWPMTHVVLKSIGTMPAAGTRGMQGTLRTTFPFEEPISLTFSVDAEQRTMTRWLVAGQSSPTFEMHDGAGGPVAEDSPSPWQYVAFGFAHILPKGLDHVLFVLGLYLGARSFRSLLVLVTSFTVAHSITLGLAALGVVRLPSGIVEPLIAASIVWVGIENFIAARPGGRGRTEKWRPLVVFGFGLLHGLGFASALSELRLPAGSFLFTLLSFNVGIEIGQLAVIGLALAATLWFRGKSWYRPRVAVPASLAIAALAALWTLERISA